MSYNDVLQYPQIAITMENIKDNSGKFYIPSLMSMMGKNNIETKSTSQGTLKALNGDITKVKCDKSNYIELDIPDYIRKSIDGDIPKGTKFVIVFLGGDISRPVIIGVV